MTESRRNGKRAANMLSAARRARQFVDARAHQINMRAQCIHPFVVGKRIEMRSPRTGMRNSLLGLDWLLILNSHNAGAVRLPASRVQRKISSCRAFPPVSMIQEEQRRIILNSQHAAIINSKLEAG